MTAGGLKPPSIAGKGDSDISDEFTLNIQDATGVSDLSQGQWVCDVVSYC